jgi:hypothetical protein
VETVGPKVGSVRRVPRRAAWRSGIALTISLAAAAPAAAQSERSLPDEDPAAASASRSLAGGDPSFGPLLTIERIEVVGNGSTASRLIERALPVKRGDVLRAGDPRMVTAELKVYALGFFRRVEIRLARGSRRGLVVVRVEVEERGTVVLERLHFGTTQVTPWWAGIDVTERNLAGSGLGVGAGFVLAGEGDAEGASDQRAFQLRLRADALLGVALGWHMSFHWVDASEPFRVSGDASDGDAEGFAAFDYRRTGGRAGIDLGITPLAHLSLSARAEQVEASPPSAPTRQLPDGTLTAVDLSLLPGLSRVVTVSLGFDRDTRSDPVLTSGGDRLMLYAELGGSWLGSDYDYGTALARYERWWPVTSVRHVVSVHLTGGIVLGDAPRFDLLHVGDLNRMVSPRALGLVVSATPSLDLLGTSTDDVTYGEVGGVAELQYAYRLFRDRFKVYGGDLFVRVGLWGLAQRDDLRVRDESLWRALPIDVMVDLGLRLDTEIGIFELGLGNALGRVPL